MPDVPTLPTVSAAPSNRSKCQSCKEVIVIGELRVGMPDRHNGLSVTKWLHPQCFARTIKTDLAPTARARCASDGTAIAKGSPRLLFRILSCEGAVKNQKIYKVANAKSFIDTLRAAGAEVATSSLDGVSELPEEHRRWVEDALAGRDLSGREPPVAEGAKAGGKVKVKSPAKPAAKQPVKRAAEEETEADGKAKAKSPAKPAAKQPVKRAAKEETEADEKAKAKSPAKPAAKQLVKKAAAAEAEADEKAKAKSPAKPAGKQPVKKAAAAEADEKAKAKSPAKPASKQPVKKAAAAAEEKKRPASKRKRREEREDEGEEQEEEAFEVVD